MSLFLAMAAVTPLQGATKVAKCIAVLDQDAMGNSIANPTRIFYHELEDNIYAVDAGNNRCIVYSSGYFPIHQLGLSQNKGNILNIGLVDKKIGVITRNQGGQNRIQILNNAFYAASSLPLKDAQTQYYAYTQGLNGDLYLVPEGGGAVHIYNEQGISKGRLQPREKFLGIREPAKIIDIESDDNGNLYLLSEERGRVYVYNNNEELLYKFGQKGGDRGKLARPRGIAVDLRNEKIFIVDYLRHAVSIYTLKGNYINEFGGKGYARGWLYYPSDVEVDGQGNILVADTFNDRIQVFSLID